MPLYGKNFTDAEKAEVEAAKVKVREWSKTLDSNTRMMHGCSAPYVEYRSAHSNNIITQYELDLLRLWYGDMWNYAGD